MRDVLPNETGSLMTGAASGAGINTNHGHTGAFAPQFETWVLGGYLTEKAATSGFVAVCGAAEGSDSNP